jgi:hypothetical protein
LLDCISCHVCSLKETLRVDQSNFLGIWKHLFCYLHVSI